MSMIANDRFPDVPMATQGQNQWSDDSLGEQVDAGDEAPGGQNLLTLGEGGGFEWSRARPSGRDTFHKQPPTPVQTYDQRVRRP